MSREPMRGEARGAIRWIWRRTARRFALLTQHLGAQGWCVAVGNCPRTLSERVVVVAPAIANMARVEWFEWDELKSDDPLSTVLTRFGT